MNPRRIVLVAVVVMLIGSTSLLWLLAPDRPAGPGSTAGLEAILWPAPQPIADFELTTRHGEPFGPESFAGRWSLVFFGYLDCPDVCPMSLGAMRAMQRRLADSMAVYYTTQGSAGEQNPLPRIEHTSSLMIVGPDGRTLGAFQPPLEPSRMSAALEVLVRAAPESRFSGN